MSSDEIIKFCFVWGPTILFFSVIILSFIGGMIKGFRKSLILAINALVAFTICLIAFFVIVNNENVDANIVSAVNWGLNLANQDSLQSLLNVSSESTTLTDILIELVIKNMDANTAISNIVNENGEYIFTIVHLLYHMIFAFILWIVYFILLFILYLIYTIFYPERRRKRRARRNYREGISDTPYSKHFLLGGLVGGLRGFVRATVFLSFLGSLLFLISGGIGSKKYDDFTDVKFEDEALDTTYVTYRCIGSYGSTGIIKIFNSIKDKNQVPYYLYISDLIFQGKLKDEEKNINDNMILRKELSPYTKLINDFFNLMLEYDSEDVVKLVKGTMNNDGTTPDVNAIDILSKLFENENFQNDVNKIIDEFEGETYLINFALSLVDSITSHIDEFVTTDSSDEVTKEILKILFTGENKITVSNLLNKEEAKQIAKLAVGIFVEQKSMENETTLEPLDYYTIYGEKLIPVITELSMFTDEKKRSVGNAVIQELYDYGITLMTEEINSDSNSNTTIYTSEEAIKLSSTSTDEVDWIGEFVTFLNGSLDIIDLYKKISTESEPVDGIFNLLSTDNPDFEENEKLYDRVAKMISDSKILGLVLTLPMIQEQVNSILASISPTGKMPTGIEYTNKYSADGVLVKEGEIGILLDVIKILIAKDGKIIYDIIQSGNFDMQAIRNMCSIFEKPVDDSISSKTVLSRLLDSYIIKFSLSQIVENLELDEDIVIYVPLECKEDINGETLIKKSSVLDLFNIIPTVLDMLDESENDFSKMLKSENLTNIISQSKIVEATLANSIIQMSNSIDGVVMPNSLSTVEPWLYLDEENNTELINLINQIKNLDIDFNNFDMKSIKLNKEKVMGMTKSKLLHYNISYQLSENLQDTITVPNKAIDDTLSNGEKYNYVKKTEIEKLFDSLLVLLPNSAKDEFGNISIASISFDEIKLTPAKVDLIIESDIIHYNMSIELSKVDSISIPNKAYDIVKSLGEKNNFILSDEIKSFTEGLFALLDKTAPAVGEEETNENTISLDGINIKSINISKPKLDNIVKSKILHYNLSHLLVQNIEEENVPNEAYDYSLSINEEFKYITKTELDNMLTVFSEILPTENKDSEGNAIINLNDISFDGLKISSDMAENEIPKSCIVYSMFTSTIVKQLDGDVPMAIFCTYDNRLESAGEKTHYILPKEFSAMINVISKDGTLELSTSSTNSFSFNKVNSSQIEVMKESILLRYKLSTIILSNSKGESKTLYVPLGVIENGKDSNNNDIKYLTKDEFGNFLNAFKAIGYDEVNDELSITNEMSISLPSEDKFETLSVSAIVRATITNSLNITNGSTELELYVIDSDIDTLSSNDLFVLNKNAIFDLMTSIKTINGSNTSFDASLDIMTIAALNNKQIYKITKSNIIRIALNNMIKDLHLGLYDYSYENIATNVEKVSIYDFETDSNKDMTLTQKSIGIYGVDPALATYQAITLMSLSTKNYDNVYTYCDDSNNISSVSTIQTYFAVIKSIIGA